MNREELSGRLVAIKDKLTSIEETAENRVFLVCESENSYAVNKFLFEDLGLRFIIITLSFLERRNGMHRYGKGVYPRPGESRDRVYYAVSAGRRVD